MSSLCVKYVCAVANRENEHKSQYIEMEDLWRSTTLIKSTENMPDTQKFSVRSNIDENRFASQPAQQVNSAEEKQQHVKIIT